MSVAYDVHIMRVSTGEVRVYNYPGEWDYGHDYMWSDGNYGCDCNRSLFFARAGGEPDDETQCGETAFKIVKITQDGKEIDIDFD